MFGSLAEEFFGRILHETLTDDDKLWPEMASAAVVLQLDALFGVLAVLSWIHAASRRGVWKGTALVGFLAVHTALFEHLSLFLGGTHCHATSPLLPAITPCSSVNSVLFYVPWIYTSLEAARRLRLHPLAFPFAVGLLQFGFGVVYEMQGPTNHFWRWPEDESGIIAASPEWLASWEGYPPLAMLEDARRDHEVATIDGGGVFRVSTHAGNALTERLFGFPVLAPYFHFAYGFAWAAGLVAAGALAAAPKPAAGVTTAMVAATTTSPSLIRIVIAGLNATICFVGPIELTRRLADSLGWPCRSGILLSLGISLVHVGLFADLFGPAEAPAAKARYSTADPLLFFISFLMHAFFTSFPWRATTPTPPGLVTLVATVAALHLAAQWYCCFIAVPSGHG